VTTLENIADLVVRRGAAPAAAVAVAGRREGVFRIVTGVAGALGARASTIGPEHAPIFDLASVTKPFVAVTAARLARRGAVELEAPLERYLPELSDTPSARVPLIAFLAHRGRRPSRNLQR
jgi:CubicO group peptidase (beta-lactamase class C family)